MNKTAYIIIGAILVIGLIWYVFGENAPRLGGEESIFTWTETPFEQYSQGTLNLGTGDEIRTGCMLEDALNYDPTANVENGTCIFEMGCCDINAANYDPTANSCWVEGNTQAQCDYSNAGGFSIATPTFNWSTPNQDTLDAHAFSISQMIKTNYMDFILEKCAERDDCELKQMTKKGANSNLANFKHCQNPYGCLWATKPNSTKLITGWDDNDNPEYLALTQCGIVGHTEWKGCEYGGNPPYEYINSPFAEQVEDIRHAGSHLYPRMDSYDQYLDHVETYHDSYNS
jgi:hypothetical protein